MSKDLTISSIERQNILNNKLAIEKINSQLEVSAIYYNNEYCFTKKMVADFYGVDDRTVDRYIEKYTDELKFNGYVLIKGKALKEFKLHFAHDIDVVSKTTQLGLFNFRAFLNIGMLLTESEKAKYVRSVILDIVIATINEKVGGGTKYINRRDAAYLPTAIMEENYRKAFTSAISSHVSGHVTMKYAQVSDKIYQAIFKENAREYKKILKLDSKDNPRHTMYKEVLLVISSFENGVSYEIKEKYNELQRKLTIREVFAIIDRLASHPTQTPYIDDARTKMASRDFGFRNAYHENIAEYLKAVSPEEFDRFIGKDSIDFDKILEDNQATLKRLKQAEDEQ